MKKYILFCVVVTMYSCSEVSTTSIPSNGKILKLVHNISNNQMHQQHPLRLAFDIFVKEGYDVNLQMITPNTLDERVRCIAIKNQVIMIAKIQKRVFGFDLNRAPLLLDLEEEYVSLMFEHEVYTPEFMTYKNVGVSQRDLILDKQKQSLYLYNLIEKPSRINLAYNSELISIKPEAFTLESEQSITIQAKKNFDRTHIILFKDDNYYERLSITSRNKLQNSFDYTTLYIPFEPNIPIPFNFTQQIDTPISKDQIHMICYDNPFVHLNLSGIEEQKLQMEEQVKYIYKFTGTLSLIQPTPSKATVLVTNKQTQDIIKIIAFIGDTNHE